MEVVYQFYQNSPSPIFVWVYIMLCPIWVLTTSSFTVIPTSHDWFYSDGCSPELPLAGNPSTLLPPVPPTSMSSSCPATSLLAFCWTLKRPLQLLLPVPPFQLWKVVPFLWHFQGLNKIPQKCSPFSPSFGKLTPNSQWYFSTPFDASDVPSQLSEISSL